MLCGGATLAIAGMLPAAVGAGPTLPIAGTVPTWAGGTAGGTGGAAAGGTGGAATLPIVGICEGAADAGAGDAAGTVCATVPIGGIGLGPVMHPTLSIACDKQATECHDTRIKQHIRLSDAEHYAHLWMQSVHRQQEQR